MALKTLKFIKIVDCEICYSHYHDRGGYVRWQGRGLHRVIWMLHNGSIPKGMEIRHTCDNPPCVNPNHLLIGTPKDNTQDSINKNRRAIQKGESHGRSKLTDNQIIQIRLSINKTQLELANIYKVSQNAIWKIKHRITWTHIF